MVRYEGVYKVSDTGFVARTLAGQGARCSVLSFIRHRHGYSMVNLSYKNIRKRCYVHRIVCEAFHGPAPEGRQKVNHKNGETDDNRPCNLEWCSQKENMDHAHYVLGTVAGRRRTLTLRAAEEIRQAYQDGKKQIELSEKYGVSQNQISLVVLGRQWTRATTVSIEKATIPRKITMSKKPEVWCKCKNFPNYLISNKGRVRDDKNLIRSTAYASGYRIVSLRAGVRGKVISVKVHRLVCQAFRGDPPKERAIVNHLDGIRDNNIEENLEWCDTHRNNRHRFGYS